MIAANTNGNRIKFIHESHLDLFWLGTSRTCLARGNDIIKQYVDRCDETGETYLIETVVFLEDFLEKHPDYRERIQRLWHNSQVDIGCAYVDVWNNLVLGESHIRNLVLGRTWLREVLDIDSKIAVHPDLPGMVAQTPQIYGKAGVKGYVTARKIFHHGSVWRYQAPDGTSLLVYIHPAHYSMPVISDDTDDKGAERGPWSRTITRGELFEGFPQGEVIVSGGAGDLADRETFVERYGRSLESYVKEYQGRWPDTDIGYGRFTEVFDDYALHDSAAIPTLSGEIPSVWGVAADETVAFFQNARRIEGLLLTAERLLALGAAFGRETKILHDDPWYGPKDNDVFFSRRDVIPEGDELTGLWKMHLFSQDHNGGGKEGAQSQFIKQGIQNRLFSYLESIIDQALPPADRSSGGNTGWIVFNPHNWTVQTSIEIPGETSARLVTCEPLGFGRIEPDRVPVETESVSRIRNETGSIVLENRYLQAIVDTRTGVLRSLRRRDKSHDWGSERAFEIYAVQETGNDVTIRVDEDSVEANETARVYVSHSDEMYAECCIEKQIKGAPLVQKLRVWNSPDCRVDVETQIRWYGEHNLQVRMIMPTSGLVGSVRYGSSFGGVSWDEVVPGSGPSALNHDEISMSDWRKYREVQGWVACTASDESSLTVATPNPGFVMQEGRLEAVLLRTSPSCGDPNFYWTNAGELSFEFRLFLSDAHQDDTYHLRRAMEMLMPPIVRYCDFGSNGIIRSAPPVQFQGDSVILSALLPADGGAPRSIVARLYESAGQRTTCRVRSDVLSTTVEEIDFYGRRLTLVGEKVTESAVDFNPFEIKTLRLTFSE